MLGVDLSGRGPWFDPFFGQLLIPFLATLTLNAISYLTDDVANDFGPHLCKLQFGVVFLNSEDFLS